MNRIAGLVLGLSLLSSPVLAQEVSPPPQLAAAVDPAKTLAEGQAFLATNAKAPGVVTTASGLQYKVVKSGPKTGKSPSGLRSVTILADDGLTTEGLSKCLFVMGLERGMRLIESQPGVDAVVVDTSGVLHYSSGLLDGASQPHQ